LTPAPRRAPSTAALIAICCAASCRGPSGPRTPPVVPRTLEVGRAGAVLAGVAGSATTGFVALTETGSAASRSASPLPGSARTVVEAHALDRPDAAAPVWHTELDGHGGPLAAAGRFVAVAVGGTGGAAGLELRGEPGAAVVALDAATGGVAWKLAIDATEWAVIASIAASSDGVLIGGSFSGTLRAGAQVVSSGGGSDGFVARLTAAGQIAWLLRVGGPGADAVQGVAMSGERIAIAGTFAAGADLRGLPMSPFDERLLAADGFVAELDDAGAARWVQTFGGKADEAVAGVAIDASGRIAIAASVRDTVHVGVADLTASGPADGLVAWWKRGGEPVNAALVGGADFDGLRAIAPAGDHVFVGGFYSGALRLGSQALVAAGGDDAFIAELDAGGSVAGVWPVSGEGREEITALAAIPGGFIAGIAHTAAVTIGGDRVAAPADPLGGAAVIVRPLH
jgi:hypothetical protein